MKIRIGLGISVVAALVLVVGVTALAAGAFSDDDGNTHEGNIEAIAAEGVTRGCNPPTNDLYCPGDDVSRGAMAAFLGRARGLADDGGRDWFTDDNGHTFEGDINRLAAAGITRGCNPPDNDRYCPDEPVTRGAMAAFLVRAFGYTAGAGDDLFDDDDGITFENDIDILGTAGVTKGCNPPANNFYCPDETVKRDTMASFIARAMGLQPIPPAPDPTTTTTMLPPGCDPSYPDFCIPPPPPDLNCGDIPQGRFTVLSPDPHNFDADGNGIGCESN